MIFALSSRVTRTVAVLLAVAVIGGGVAGAVAGAGGHSGTAQPVTTTTTIR
jgi:hypothetical protein